LGKELEHGCSGNSGPGSRAELVPCMGPLFIILTTAPFLVLILQVEGHMWHQVIYQMIKPEFWSKGPAWKYKLALTVICTWTLNRGYLTLTRGVSHWGLAIYIKKYVKAKEELWKLKYFTMQKYNFQKNPLKEIKNPSRYYNSVTNLKFQHNPKYHLSKILR
jgi:hypothetical protein